MSGDHDEEGTVSRWRDAGGVTRDLRVLLKNGETLDIGDGDFRVLFPDNEPRKISLRTGFSVFPIGTTQGQPPADFVIRLLETRSVAHAWRSYGALRQFDAFVAQETVGVVFSWDMVDEAFMLRYLANIRSRTTSRNDFQYVRYFYRWAADLRYPGFDGRVAAKLFSVSVGGGRLEARAASLVAADPGQRVFSEAEFRLILRSLSSEEGGLLPRVCTSLAVELGANPAQFCQLRLEDYVVRETGGDPIYQLRLPRSKKGDDYKDRRLRSLSPVLGRLLGSYVDDTARAREALGMERPFLLLNERGRPLRDCSFDRALKRFAQGSGLAATTPGTFNTRRYRKTHATRLVEAGASEDELMDLLDHSTTLCLSVYFEQRGDAVAKIDASVGETLRAVAARFAGTLVGSESEAELGDRPEQRVVAPLEAGNVGIGTCGRDIRSKDLCGMHPPYSCYTCPLFQAWKDADHAGLASEVEAKRRDLVEIEGGDERGRVVGQLDELILAVREVAESCEGPREEGVSKRWRGRRDAGGGNGKHRA